MIASLKTHLAGLLILALSLAIGLTVFDDYGLAWDEEQQRKVGLYSYNFVVHGNRSLQAFQDRYYGVAFELPLIQAEKSLKLRDTRDIFLMRHLVSHLFFLLSGFVLYLLIFKLLKSRLAAVSGYLMLLINPVIYAHSFFNTKDIPLMSMFIFCLFLAALAFQKQSVLYFIAFGVFSGLLIDMRILGILIVPIAVFLSFTDLVGAKDKKRSALLFLVYGLSLPATVFLAWPYIQEKPLTRFVAAFEQMSQYQWVGGILMFGKHVMSTNIDWTYIPIWFGLTTPIFYLILGFLGFAFLVRDIFREPRRFFLGAVDRNWLVYLGAFFGPVFIIIAMRSTLYDGWRHVFFIYPAFILIAVYALSGARKLKQPALKRALSAFMIVGLALAFAGTGVLMIKSHPQQNVYFNAFVPNEEQYIRWNFEMDYWGTSYRQALEFILRNDRAKTINIMVANAAGLSNLKILDIKDRGRIKFVSNEFEADYFISNYRWHPTDYMYLAEKRVFRFRVLNSDVVTAWKISNR